MFRWGCGTVANSKNQPAQTACEVSAEADPAAARPGGVEPIPRPLRRAPRPAANFLLALSLYNMHLAAWEPIGLDLRGYWVQNEESLVQRAKRGEAEAFEHLYEANFDRIYRYLVLKVGSRADAEDITQQVFLRALESIGSFRWRGTPFSSWLFRIAHNQVIDHYRKKNRERTLPLDEARSVSSSSNDPAALAEQRLRIEQLAVACEQLTDAQREVVSLRFAGGLSVAETAKAMGKSEGAVKVMQHDALRKLRRILSPVGEEASGRAV
jgi:RNA polymerase sigma-70 factor (ECF subfamily)